MTWLVVGVLVWSVAHLLKSLAAPLRQPLVRGLGNGPYQGLFSLVILGSLALMVLGWRSTPPTWVYVPPVHGSWATNVAVLLAFVLFAASGMPTNLKRLLRHPQLTGLLIWAGGHLLSNGEQRSLVLFGGLGLWSIVAMLAINRRDGTWHKPEPVPASADLKAVLGGAVVFAVVFFLHPWFTGMSPAPH